MGDALSTKEAVRIELVRASVRGEGALERAFAQALRLSASALDVRRVGIWFAEDGFRRIRCRMMYDAETERLGSGDVIDLSASPRYQTALRSRRSIVADDARTDPRTSELLLYLDRNGITSMLDSPIFQAGELVGVVCHEHIGPQRAWSRNDADFVATISDMIGLYLEQDAQQQTYKALLEARSELEQTRVMEALGRMAAGVAHDFNNLLGAISLSAERLARTAQDPSAGKDVASLVDQGGRLVKSLLTFARQERGSQGAQDLVALVQRASSSLRSVAGRDVTVEFVLPASPIRVALDPVRFEQLLLNLVVNARDAMIGGGRVRVEVASEDDGREAALHVLDTGVGMSEHTKRHMFEPFFTTKESGKGAGLGLSIVYAIVQESGGRIQVDSAEGEGTAITVRWRVAE